MEKQNRKRFWVKLLAIILVGLMAFGSVYATIALIVNMW